MSTDPAAAHLGGMSTPESVSTLVEHRLDLLAQRTEAFVASTVEDDMRAVAQQAYALGVAEGRKAAETMRGDVHHHINPAIGWLRLRFMEATGLDLLAVPYGADRLPDTTGLPETVSLDTSLVVSTVRTMEAATDAADAALGEEPIREQIARIKAEAEQP